MTCSGCDRSKDWIDHIIRWPISSSTLSKYEGSHCDYICRWCKKNKINKEKLSSYYIRNGVNITVIKMEYVFYKKESQ